MFHILKQSSWINFGSNRHPGNKQRYVYHQRNWPYFTSRYSSRSSGQVVDYQDNKLWTWRAYENPSNKIFNREYQAFTLSSCSTWRNWFKDITQILCPTSYTSMGFGKHKGEIWNHKRGNWRCSIIVLRCEEKRKSTSIKRRRIYLLILCLL